MTLYRYILLRDLDAYLADGWTLCGPLYPIGGWESVLVEKKG